MNAARTLIALILLAAAPAMGADRLVVISPHWEGLRYEFGRAFSDWHARQFDGAVEIDWRDLGGTSDDLRFVTDEFKKRPDGIGIDLFFGGGSDPYLELARRDLLEPYQPPERLLAAIPRQIGGVPLYDPEFRWFGVALSGFGILCNKRVLTAADLPEVRTWRELAERAPVGCVGSGDPRNSGSTHMIYELILQRYGWDEGWAIIAQLAAKVRGFDRASSTTAKDVVTGNTAYALAIDFYALTQIAYAGKDNLVFVLPEDCVAISPDGVAILRGAPHREIAQRFVQFLISETGQKLLMLPKGHPEGAQKFSIERMSVLPGLYDRYREVSLVTINPFALRVSFSYDAAKGSARWNLVNDLIGATIIDVQPELIAAWKRGVRGAAFGRPPLTEAEAMTLAAGRWRDTAFRQKTLLEWQRWAQEKYRRAVQ